MKKPPFADSREKYILNLVNPKKNDRILLVGISNIPKLEKTIEKKLKNAG